MAQPSQEGQEQEVTQGWGGLVRCGQTTGSTQRRQQRGGRLCLPQEGATEGPGPPSRPPSWGYHGG